MLGETSPSETNPEAYNEAKLLAELEAYGTDQ